MKKIIIPFIIVLGIGTIVYLFLLLTHNIYSTYEKYYSYNKKYVIEIKGNGPSFPFGSEDIKIIAYKNNILNCFNKKVYKTKISNDGKGLTPTNFSVSWNENKALIILNGEEQKNEYIEAVFDSKISIGHKGLDYEVVKCTENCSEVATYKEIESPIYGTIHLTQFNMDIYDKNENTTIFDYDSHIDYFVQTLKYEKEKGMATIKWEDKGNAYVYKNNQFTFIECNYDRYNDDYSMIKDQRYKKYILGRSDLEYKYEMCKPK